MNRRARLPFTAYTGSAKQRKKRCRHCESSCQAKTHATNPRWTPHARFHVVWQISSYCGFALLALALVWTRGPMYVERLYLVCAFAAIVYGAFFVALATMRLYGGGTYDDNGYPPFAVPLTGWRWDVNVTAFCVFVLVLLVAAGSVSRAAG